MCDLVRSAGRGPPPATLGPLADTVTRVTVRGGMDVAVQAPGAIRLFVQSPGFYSLPRTKPKAQLRLPAIHETTQVRPSGRGDGAVCAGRCDMLSLTLAVRGIVESMEVV